MKTREKVELALIAAAAGGTVALASKLPASIAAGELVLASAVMLLGQGLIRDLWIKYGEKKAHAPAAEGSEPAAKPRGLFCMCMESTLGMLGVVIGAALLLSGLSFRIALPGYFWPAGVFVVGVAGFIIKDYVLDWQQWPWRIRREENHSNVIFW